MFDFEQDDTEPTFNLTNGTKLWYKDNKLHRKIGPAVMYNTHDMRTGEQDIQLKWYKNGKLHREDGPAVLSSDGIEYWYQNDKLHRVDGPAVNDNNDYQAWYSNGYLHRLDGPAVTYANGVTEYWINGVMMSELEFFVNDGQLEAK